MKVSLVIISAFVLLVSCRTDPVFPETPEIEFVSISPDQGQQFVDELKIIIHFQDGDGDIGYQSDPLNNLWVVDTRADIPDSLRSIGFSIPSLTPETKNPSIQGEIEISVLTPPSAKFFNPSSLDTEVIFDVYLVDRKGNRSNTIQTDPVTILE